MNRPQTERPEGASVVRETVLLPSESAALRDHLVAGKSILPGAAVAELVLAAAGAPAAATLRDVVFLAPLVLEGPAGLKVRIVLEHDPAEAEARFEIRSSRAASASAPTEAWASHAVGRVALAAPAVTGGIDLGAIRSRCQTEVCAAELYGALASYGLVYGPFYRSLERARVGHEEVLAELALSAQARDENGAYTLHPALLDGALQCVALLPPPEPGAPAELPFGIGRLSVHRSLPERVVAHVRRTAEGTSRRIAVTLASADGEVLAQAEQIALRPLKPAQPAAASRVHLAGQPFFHVPRPVQAAGPGRAPCAGTWLVLAEGGAQEAVARALPAGSRVVFAEAGTAFGRLAPHRFGVQPERAEDWEALVAATETPLAGAVHAWCAGPEATVEEELRRGGVSLALLVGALERRLAGSALALRVVTTRAETVHGEPVVPPRAALAGVVRVASLEQGALEAQLVDLEVDPGLTAEALRAAWDAAPVRGVFSWRGHVARELRLQTLADGDAPGQPLALRRNGVCLITGGAGGLGLRAARVLGQDYGARVALVQRRALPNRERWAEVARSHEPAAATVRELVALDEAGVEVMPVQADVCDRAQLTAAVEAIEQRWGAIHAVIHAAGTLRDGKLRSLRTAAPFWDVLRPKVLAAYLLDEVCAGRGHRLDFFLAYSSASTLLGNVGQATYVAANSVLAEFAEWRTALRREPTLAVEWTIWSQCGMAMAAVQPLAARGVVALDDANGARALREVLRLGARRIVVANLAPGVGRPFKEYELAGRDSAGIENGAARSGAAPAAQAQAGAPAAPALAMSAAAPAVAPPVPARASMTEVIREAVARIIEAPAVRLDVEAGFIDLGLDSLLAVKLVQAIEDEAGVEIKVADVFDHPTIASLARYLEPLRPAPVAQAPAHDAASQVETVRPIGRTPSETRDARSRRGLDMAIVGMACRFPGAPSVEAYWDLLREGREAVVEIPKERWDIDHYFDADPETPFGVYCRRGGFVRDIDRFDADFFGISPREAQAMDPQQRVMLELAWHALEHGGHADARGTRTGLFVGASNSHYGDELVPHPFGDSFASLGNTRALIPSRISYFLDLKGPSCLVDTLCSSSLVAIDQACRAVRAGQCDQALVGAVSLCLTPWYYMTLSRFRALSPSGRCQPFGRGADGFVPGEGAAMLLVKPLEQALAGRDTIYAVVRGAAVNHGGRASGLTAPSSLAQSEVIAAALDDAGVAADDIDYVEAHGTGTALGDPIEAEGLARAFASRTWPEPCGLGSVKGNVGHLEAAAGMASIVKIVLALQHEALPASLHAEHENPRLRLAEIPFRLVRELSPWRRAARCRLAGVSSFGLGGTNAHIILEEPPVAASRAAEAPAPGQIFLSARTPEAMRRLRESVRGVLASGSGPRLADLCYTLAVGRAHFRYRLVAAGNDRSALVSALDRAEVVDSTKQPAEGPGSGLGADVTARYLRGETIPWGPAFAHEDVRRIAAPTYPFDHERRLWTEPGPPRPQAPTVGPAAVPIVGPAAAPDAGPVAARTVAAAEPAAVALAAEGSTRALEGAIPRRERIVRLVRRHVGQALGEAPESIDPRTPFRDKGIDSIAAVGIVRALEREAPGLDLSPTLLFDHPTIEALVQVLEAEHGARFDSLTIGRGEFEPRASRAPAALEGMLHDEHWQEAPLEASADALPEGRWLVLSDGQGMADEIMRRLSGAAVEWIVARPDSAGPADHRLPCDEAAGAQLLDALGVRERPLAGVLHLPGFGRRPSASTMAALAPGHDSLFVVAAALQRRQAQPFAIRVLTANAQAVRDEERSVAPEAAAIWGLVRTLAAECPSVRFHLLDAALGDDPGSVAAAFLAEWRAHTRGEAACRAGRRWQRHFGPLAAGGAAQSIPERPLVLVTGGLGGLGSAVARWLATEKGARLVLVQRSALPPRARWDAWRKEHGPDDGISRKLAQIAAVEASGGEVMTVAADAGDAEALRGAVAAARQWGGRIDVVVHAAGFARDAAFLRKRLADAHAVMRPKVEGVAALDEATADEAPLMVLFGSLAGAAGNPGQADYAAANAYLRAYGLYRRRLLQRPTLVIDWSAWAEVGMAVRLAPQLTAIGMEPIEPQQGVAAMAALLERGVERALVGRFHRPFPIAELHSPGPAGDEREERGTARGGSRDAIPAKGGAGAVAQPEAPRASSDLGREAPVHHPSAREASRRASPAAAAAEREPIAIIGMACRFPGARTAGEYWALLREGRSAIREVPALRWDVGRYWDPEPGRPGKTYAKWGGFVDGLDEFDPLLFNIPPVEAELMDPQQRFVLELAYEAFEHAGYGAEAVGSRTGVFVGCSYANYAQERIADLDDESLFNLGNALPIIANRVSYVFDLAGPSVLVNTLCSSSLVAVDAAMRSLRAGQCDMALAGGVHLCLTPRHFLHLSSLRALSPRGVSAPFDAQADGFVPGEGAGLVLLKSVSAARRDGDRVLAVLRGSAVNHGGRGNGLTAPSAQKQADVVLSALKDAAVSANSIDYVEAHGTGTLLGDPIEVQGLTRAFALAGGAGGRCGLGSVKSNLGHTEPAAGIAGLLKVILALRHQRLPRTLNVTEVNPLLGLAQTPFRIVREEEPWPRNGVPRRAGVSSFGLGGTNAHVIVEEALDDA